MNPCGFRTAATRTIVVAGVALFAAAGCNKKADNTSNYKTAINTYFSARPACLWSEPKKFPVQAGTSDESKTSDYDALVDQGLLTRTTAEKKVFIVASKQVNNYDLSDKGRSEWKADAQQPGYGNFCYGHRSVSSIDSATPNNGNAGSTATVDYHYTLSDVPGWASAAETQNAYPNLKAALAGPEAAQANLTDTSNGWVVTSTGTR